MDSEAVKKDDSADKGRTVKKGAIVDNDYTNKDETVKGAKCAPKKGDPEAMNKFPPACEIISRPKK